MRIQCGWKVLSGVLLSITLGVSCASPAPRGRFYVPVGPPAPLADVRVVAPGPNYVWVPGYHRWDGAAYAWVPGAWQLPPQPRAMWVPGHWAHERHGWFFVQGHWRA